MHDGNWVAFEFYPQNPPSLVTRPSLRRLPQPTSRPMLVSASSIKVHAPPSPSSSVHCSPLARCPTSRLHRCDLNTRSYTQAGSAPYLPWHQSDTSYCFIKSLLLSWYRLLVSLLFVVILSWSPVLVFRFRLTVLWSFDTAVCDRLCNESHVVRLYVFEVWPLPICEVYWTLRGTTIYLSKLYRRERVPVCFKCIWRIIVLGTSQTQR